MIDLDTILHPLNVMDPLGWYALADSEEERGGDPGRYRKVGRLLEKGDLMANARTVEQAHDWNCFHHQTAIHVQPALAVWPRWGLSGDRWLRAWRISSGRALDEPFFLFDRGPECVPTAPGTIIVVATCPDRYFARLYCHPVDLPEVCDE